LSELKGMFADEMQKIMLLVLIIVLILVMYGASSCMGRG